MTYDAFKTLCLQRRSIRNFDSKPITREEVLELLELAHLAPSIENTQPWHFHAVMSAELRQKLMDTSCYGNFVEGASIFLVCTVQKDALPATQEILWNPRELEYSCMAAMVYALLGATAKEIGSCWVSLHRGEAHALLHLPMNQVVVGGIMLGHLRKGEGKPSGPPNRKPVTDITTFYE